MRTSLDFPKSGPACRQGRLGRLLCEEEAELVWCRCKVTVKVLIYSQAQRNVWSVK